MHLRALRIVFLPVFIMHLCGCLFAKVANVPIRITGAVISVVPVVGNSADAIIDGATDVVDEIPL